MTFYHHLTLYDIRLQRHSNFQVLERKMRPRGTSTKREQTYLCYGHGLDLAMRHWGDVRQTMTLHNLSTRASSHQYRVVTEYLDAEQTHLDWRTHLCNGHGLDLATRHWGTLRHRLTLHDVRRKRHRELTRGRARGVGNPEPTRRNTQHPDYAIR